MEKSEDLEGEIWKQHPLGIMVSNMGRVWTRNNGKWYGGDNGDSYKRIERNGKKYLVSRLICEAFHDNPNNLPTVDHIDRNPSNNRADNLRWASLSTQMKNREVDWKARTANTDYKAIAEKVGAKLSIPILQLNKNLEVVKEWNSITEAARTSGFYQGNICSCLKGKLKTAYGFKWRYKKSEAV